jgi:hypothetical protein
LRKIEIDCLSLRIDTSNVLTHEGDKEFPAVKIQRQEQAPAVFQHVGHDTEYTGLDVPASASQQLKVVVRAFGRFRDFIRPNHDCHAAEIRRIIAAFDALKPHQQHLAMGTHRGNLDRSSFAGRKNEPDNRAGDETPLDVGERLDEHLASDPVRSPDPAHDDRLDSGGELHDPLPRDGVASGRIETRRLAPDPDSDGSVENVEIPAVVRRPGGEKAAQSPSGTSLPADDLPEIVVGHPQIERSSATFIVLVNLDALRLVNEERHNFAQIVTY